jgi:lysophospholipase L1-like esterase
MKYLWIALAAFIWYVAYEIVRVKCLVTISAGLVGKAHSYKRSSGRLSLLVLGDSSAVGVGAAHPDESVAGRLATALDASVENYAVSGAFTADLAAQFRRAERERYDLILIQIGVNDVIRFRSVGQAGQQLEVVLKEASKKSDRIVVLTAGKIGHAPFFPRLFGFIFTLRARALRARFMKTARAHGAIYVDLYRVHDIFRSEPRRYYAPDGLHLTGEGYGCWFDKVKQAIEKTWPDVLAHGK